MASTDSAEGKDREEFVVEASFYGDPPGWWITAEG
jgi:hypothetical protein